MMAPRRTQIALALLCAGLMTQASRAQEGTAQEAAPKEGAPQPKAEPAPEQLDEVRVIGHYENAVGTSDAASQGYITPGLIEARPTLRPAEVLEYIPGVIVTQHSGDGKANQYFLRGFNLDHGTDFRTEVDHVPVNMPTHAHGQGYSDLNFLIPELVQRIQYKKGPYFAEEGDFSSAGAADISYTTKLPQGIGTLTAGPNGYARAMAANSSDAGPGTLLYGLEAFHNNGPWDNPENYRKLNGVMRFSQGTNADGYTLSLMAYTGKWNATDQIASRAVDQEVSRFGSLDPSDGGQTSRYSVALDRHLVLDNGGVLHVDAYAVKYQLDLFSNFTYFLDNPVQGDQFEQYDNRWVFGIAPTWVFNDKWGGRATTNKFGLDVRRDNINLALNKTFQRDVIGTTRKDYVQQTGTGLFYENTYQWTDTLRSVAGIREDFYYAKVNSDFEGNSGTTNAHITSPKLSLIYGPFAKTEYFLNWGQGFHSNDARGTTITVDPTDHVTPVQKVPALVKSKGEEIGIRTEAIPNLQSSLSLWRLTLASELLFVGDAGTTEASRPSLRRGIEWSNRYIPKPWLIVDLDLSLSRAEFTDSDPAGNHIPGAIDRVASFGITAKDIGPWTGSLFMRYFGPHPLIEDNSQVAYSSLIWSGRATYKVDPRTQVNLDLLNLFDRRVNDIEYYYASRLQGEPAAGVNDHHFHPAEPRTFRVSLVTRF
jgi:hypothetical protein